MRARVLCWLAAATMVLACAASAAVPPYMNYQGILLDGSGNPITTQVTVVFTIYDASTLGNNLWDEPRNVTPDAQGRFNINLGEVDPLTDAVFTGPDRWLGIKVGADPEMTPRTRLVTVGYAFRTATVDGASGGTITSKVSIGPGHTNTGDNAFVAGEGSTASGATATVGGGAWNTASGLRSAVGGGQSDIASGDWSTVGGGYVNTASALSSTVSGGFSGTASGGSSTVSGGGNNTASGAYSAIGGGALNRASGESATVGGGGINTAIGGWSTVGGGQSDTAIGGWSTVSGGFVNVARSVASTVSGGQDNTASANFAAVGGGGTNTASGLAATISGGATNAASGLAAMVGGGKSDTASGDYATIGGGQENIASGRHATIGGGQKNIASGWWATVGGGEENTASGNTKTTVGGGAHNTASGDSSTVGGGGSNTASGVCATVGGGTGNTANSFGATVGGGLFNAASGEAATVGGGEGNGASGDFATVPGGFNNHADDSYSFAAGKRAHANHSGTFVWADDNAYNPITGFPSTQENQFSARATGGARFVTGIDMFGNATAGVQVAAGGTSWSAICDRNLKENFAPVDAQVLLEKVAELPMQTWNAKAQDPSIRHIGPVAQDFYAAFGVGEDSTHITTVDADGVALAAIQGLYQQNQELKKQVDELQALVQKLLDGRE